MPIDWIVVAQIGGPILAATVGAFAHWWLTRGPRLIVYFGHTSVFTLRSSDENPLPITTIHTHTLIIRNMGRSAANNVRMSENVVADIVGHTKRTITFGLYSGGVSRSPGL